MNREQILGALARGYCTDANRHKVMDSTLVLAMAAEILALRGLEAGEPTNREKIYGPLLDKLKPKAGEADVWLAVESHNRRLAALRSKVAELDAANAGLAQEAHDLQQICRDAYEVWAGSEVIPVPKTRAEAYLLQLLKNMKDEIKRGLK